jgi:crotonobetainyl-CoA:carnitine CoA-transferase CaiB-like acyl-CoA transferase
MPGPLAGFRIVDLSAVVSGPLATMLLADQGAEVIKIEPSGGDTTRMPLFERGGITPLFANVNRGKRSLVLDLDQPRAREIVLQLAAEADVFVQNFRPGAIERMGLGEEAIRAVRSDIVYVSINGFGETGPYAKRRAYDPIIQGLSGHIAVQRSLTTGERDVVRTITCDKATAYTAAQAITAALLARERGAGGQHVRISMLDASLAFFWPDGMQRHTMIGDGVGPGGTWYESFRLTDTADGQILVYVATQGEFEAFCRAVGHPEWIDDPRFRTMPARLQNGETFRQLRDAVVRSFTSKQLLARLEAEQVPAGPVHELVDILSDPQVAANTVLVESDHPHAGRIRQARPAPRFERTPTAPGRHAPRLDEHTDEILAELGVSADEIAQLRLGGVIGVG